MSTHEHEALPSPAATSVLGSVPRDLVDQWMTDVGVDDVEAGVGTEMCLGELIARYEEPHRFYHATSHVIQVLQNLPAVLEIEGVAVDSQVARSVRLALWFHDAIYDVRSGSNEADSALLAIRSLTALGIEDSLCADVSRLVMATKHPSNPESLDEAIIIDVDLGILAAPSENYDRYVVQVRQEYAHVSDADWRIGRSKVLVSFLEADQLFYTTCGKIWQPFAEANIRRELESLAN
jgi:predicted metal-dependent HD superfamily phosphohydrolase